jgi:hypothetical protein
MSIEVQAWPSIAIQTSYTIRLVGYRIIYKSAASDLQISITATYEFLPPVGLVNSDGFNLFIGSHL